MQCFSIQQVEYSPWVVGHLFTALTTRSPHHPLTSSSSELLLHLVHCMDIFTKAVNSMHPGVSSTLQLCLSRVYLAPSLALLPESTIQVPMSKPMPLALIEPKESF